MKKITLAFLMLFTSLFAIGQCDYTLELNDSFGDGWNGNSIDVIVNGTIVLDDATLDAGSQGFETFSVTDGDAITFTVDDSGSFDGEVSYRILNNVAQEVGAGDLTDVPTEIAANCIDCTPGAAMVEVFGDCDNGEFSVVVNITDFGDATEFVVTTNYNSLTETITDTGATLLGPFNVTETAIVVTLTPQDADCVLTYEREIPCPPSNDECSGATGLGDGQTTLQNISNATPDTTGCGDTGGAAVWYFVNDGGTATEVTISTAGSDFDTIIASITGDCDNQVCGEVNDDANGTLQSEITFTTPGTGENVYILVLGFGGATGNLQISATGDGLLSTGESNQLDGFTMFPNPAQDVLNVSNTSIVENVKVFNLLGQKVLDQNLQSTQNQINVSELKPGAYLIQVTAEGQTGTYKFIKQ